MEAPTGGALLDQIFEQGLRPLEESELAERLCLAEHGLVVRVVLRQRLFRAKINVDRARGGAGIERARTLSAVSTARFQFSCLMWHADMLA